MLYSFTNIDSNIRTIEDDDQIKKRIKDLKNERKTLLSQHKILKSTYTVASYLSSINDKLNFKSKIEKIEKLNYQILELNKSRNAALSRKSKCKFNH